MSTDTSNPQEFPPSREQAPHADTLAEHAESIRKLGKCVIADVIEIGRRLSECKQLLGHGNWLPWIEREFRWGERTARNFISAYEFAQSKSANVADLAIDVSSVYLLAAPSTPEEARAEVLSRGEAGEVLPHAEVKRIVGRFREREAAAGTGKRHITVKEMIKRHYGDFAKLPAVDREKILEERPENIGLAIADATTKQLWKPPYRKLQDALDALETIAKLSTRKIIAAIPVERMTATKARVERGKDCLIKLDAKLRHDENVSKTCAADDATSLADLIKEARQANIKKYGRPDQVQVLEKIWSELNPAQIALLRSGQFGPAIKARANRLMLARERTRKMRATRRGVTSPGRGKK
jgi:hypothetical protein